MQQAPLVSWVPIDKYVSKGLFEFIFEIHFAKPCYKLPDLEILEYPPGELSEAMEFCTDTYERLITTELTDFRFKIAPSRRKRFVGGFIIGFFASYILKTVTQRIFGSDEMPDLKALREAAGRLAERQNQLTDLISLKNKAVEAQLKSQAILTKVLEKKMAIKAPILAMVSSFIAAEIYQKHQLLQEIHYEL